MARALQTISRLHDQLGVTGRHQLGEYFTEERGYLLECELDRFTLPHLQHLHQLLDLLVSTQQTTHH